MVIYFHSWEGQQLLVQRIARSQLEEYHLLADNGPRCDRVRRLQWQEASSTPDCWTRWVLPLRGDSQQREVLGKLPSRGLEYLLLPPQN